MTGQMTIYDFLPKPSDLDLLPEAEMVQIVGDAIGVDFDYVDPVWKWRARLNKRETVDIGYSNYTRIGDNRRFISCGYSYKDGGAGAPCDTIDAAIAFFKRHMGRLA